MTWTLQGSGRPLSVPATTVSHMAGNDEGEVPDRPRDHRKDSESTTGSAGAGSTSSGQSSARFELYEDVRGEWRWRLVHEDGHVLADAGEGYANRSGAREAIERIREYGAGADVSGVRDDAFEIYEDPAGEWRWRLRHDDGNVLADSGEGYGSRSAAEEAVASVRENAPGAAATEY